MSRDFLNTIIRIFIALCMTEAMLMILQNYYFTESNSVASVLINILILSIISSLIICNELSKKTSQTVRNPDNDQDFYKSAIDQHSIVATTDLQGTIKDVNDKFCEISGYSRDELIGQDHRIINSGYKDKSYWRKMYRTIARGNIWKDEVRNRSKDGNYYWVDTTIIPMMNDKGKPESYISIRTDITKQKKIQHAFKQANKKLKELSQIDELTGVANRRSYEKYLQKEAKAAQRANQSLSLLVVDIDDFKSINDTYGHDSGDIILQQIATTIEKSLTRTTDFIARLGGEEFTVINPSTDTEGAFQVAERIRKNIANFDFSRLQIDMKNQITVSVGFSTQTGVLINKDRLFKQADTALYQAKNSGKNKSVAFQKKPVIKRPEENIFS